ncbi:pregnancy zone protein-like [Dipodomys merriami]|uniref:pregnancy zone protein-like n=1 Tax=Dipodomys merriami TaxID=94247 RepID=UPI003855D31E
MPVATYKQNSHVCFDGFLDEVHQQAQHMVKNVSSSSKSYVHLELVLGTLSCGQSQEMWAHYILNEQILKDEQETFFPPGKGDPALSPAAQLLLYAVLPNGEVVADVQKAHIEHGFTNQVHLGFSSTQSLPASDIRVKVTATLLSLCALRAVDQSMLLLKPEKELSAQAVYNLLPTKTPVKSHVDAGVNKDYIYAEDIIHNGLIYSPKQDPDDQDIHSFLESVGFNILTNSKIRKPRFCRRPFGRVSPLVTEESGSARFRFRGARAPRHARRMRGLCHRSLPYAVVRGEAFELRAAAHSYLPHCTWKLCGNEVMEKPAFYLKDNVMRPLLVEPEGTEREETFNSLSCASASRTPEELSLKGPSNVVPGSARATNSVLGDILGSAMQNLQNLQLPHGCGEQNMILFIPNIHVLNYLNVTQQLTEEIKSKATSSLVSGYQTQLNYKHRDSSDSTFGDQDGRTPGNTWLKASVLKSLVHAQLYIFMDSRPITGTLHWLLQKQKQNGCFQASRSLFNNAIKGGDEVSLSAYVSIALLEMGLPSTDTVIALQALSKYGAATFTKNAKATLVTIRSSRTFSQDFQVDDSNRLLLQEVRLPDVPGEVAQW